MEEQEAVELLLELPLAFLVDAQRGAAKCKAAGEWSSFDDEASDLVETIISFRIDEGITL